MISMKDESKANKTQNTWEIKNIHDLDDVVDVVLDKAHNNSGKNAVVVALYGNLGAGKTTFTKNLAKKLNITENVTSPTFVIQKNFQINDDPNFKKLIHIDTYRIDLQDELERLGWHDNINHPENLIAVEWPENIEDILPENTIRLRFEFIDETTRRVEMK
jgi:tRNA threonylcarbamoyladenosine biosynthesis protein TsaE